MNKSLALVFFGTCLSINANAAEFTFELLAGVEAGIDTNTAMTAEDLAKTQEILSSERTGSVQSWYNTDTTTFYTIKMGKHFSAQLRPCIAYTLTTKHDSKTENQELNACLNMDGQWIATELLMPSL